MKNLSIKKISFIFLSFALLLCAFFGINAKPTSVYADEIPEYFSVVQKSGPDATGIKIDNNQTAFIGNGESVVATLSNEKITSITPYFTLNGKTHSNAVLLDTYGIEVEYNTTSFVITSSNADSKTPYGKYELNISYMIEEENNGSTVIVSKSFSFTYYVLLKTNYFNGTSVNVSINKAPLSSSGIYDNIYMYNYQDESQHDATVLPEISFNYKRFAVSITKNFQSVEKTQSFSFDGTTVNVSGDSVVFYSISDDNVKLVFNDLGSYTIDYTFIYTYDNNVETLSTFTSYAGKKKERLDMFGYQLYYSDINANGSKEFKNISTSGIMGDEITDISYLASEVYNVSTMVGLINTNNIQIQQTNQAPVQFKYNSELITSTISNNEEYISMYYMLEKGETGYNIIEDSQTSYENQPLTQAGIYLVKLVYSYSPYVGQKDAINLGNESRVVFNQWFVFEITDHTPTVQIQEVKLNDLGEIEEYYNIISDGSYTNKDVVIKKQDSSQSMFNAPTRLMVSTQENYGGSYGDSVEVQTGSPLIVNKNANYSVSLYFGKNFSRNYTSEFTIDKYSIENVQIYSANEKNESGYFYRDKIFDFYTNQSVSISWNEKASGATTYANYKYIPLVSSSEKYDNNTLKQFYANYNVPTYSYYDFNNTSLTSIAYSNSNIYPQYIPSTNILSQNGMYIFRIYDDAGNETYTSFIIDDTSAPILQKVGNEYVEASDLNILSNDVTIQFGKNRVTQFNNLVYKNGVYATQDEWLNIVLNNGADKFLTLLIINTHSTYFTTASINSKVVVNINGEFSENYILTNENNYSYDIKFAVNSDTQVALEQQYDFYVRDQINTKTKDGQPSDSYQTYTDLYSATHSVKISSDASLTELYYTNINGNRSYLSQDSSKIASGIKETYYKPTTTKTLSASNEILYLTFNPTPEEGTIEISKVSYTFQPFSTTSKTNSGNTAYTYFFNDSQVGEEIVIYDKSNSNLNKTTTSPISPDMLLWEVQKEYNSLTNSYQTKAGKYVITRTYDTTLTNYESSISDKLDYTTRTLTFIVDRNGIISAPVVVDENGTTSNYVGEPIKIQVLENDDTTNTQAMFFKNVYLATNMSSDSLANVEPILSTNKLPVQVYIPAYKYGYSYTDGGPFISEDSINMYDKTASVQDYNSKISTYKLKAEIRYAIEKSQLSVTKDVYYGSIPTDNQNNYLVFNDEGRAFSKIGFYQVNIYQGNGINDQNVFSFIFEITQNTPEFSINTTDDVTLQQSSTGNYYTNQDKIRLQWIDSSNEFLAKINKSMITYSVNNGQNHIIAPELVQTNGTLNTVDLNLREIGAYNNGTKVTISMQFEGDESRYNEGYFKTTKTLIVDTIAPTKNIANLVSLSGLSYDSLRNVTEKYNTSVSSGLYKYYAFNVDVSNFTNIIDIISTDTTETNVMGYRIFETEVDGVKSNTKYVDVYTQETDPTIIENSSIDFITINESTLPTLLENNLKYIEIYEKDLAGNITVYTIYLTNKNIVLDDTSPIIVYTTNGEERYLSHMDLMHEMNLFAKSSLNFTSLDIFNSDWLEIEIGGATYLRTPYTNGQYYNLSTYEINNPSASLVYLTDFANLSPSSAKQIIRLSLVPYFNNITINASVLNSTLSVLHTSSTTFSTSEGVLIKIPNTTSTTDATIYAVSVVISQYIISSTGTQVQQVLYTNTSSTFFQTVQSISSSSILGAEYVQYLGGIYLKFTIVSPTANRFYKYEIIDNFGDRYSLTNIYGSEEIKDELTSSVKIIENYEDGDLYHYSTKNVNFKFNSAKDRVFLTINTTLFTYGPYDIANADLSGLSQYVEVIKPSKNSVVYTVILKSAEQLMSEGKIGDQITYNLDIYETIDQDYVSPYRSVNVRIYNIIPSITLLGIDNDDQNDLFNKGTLYGNEIRITFDQLIGKYPCTVWLEYDNNELQQITSGTIVSTPTTYRLIIKYTQMFTSAEYDTVLEFTISDNEEDFYNVVYTKNGETIIANPTGSSFSYTIGTQTRTISTHYILNTSAFDIIYNTSQGIQKVDPEIINTNGYTSYIYNLTNIGSENAGSRYFSRTIAVTVINETNSILSNFSHYKNDGTRENLEGSLQSFVVSKEEDNTNYKRIAWNSYYGIPENKVMATIYFGDKNTLYTPKVEVSNNLNIITLSSSGTYYITFTDLAGNTHLFENLNDSYQIRYLRSVIFNINGETPINNAVYNDTVNLSVPSSTLKYYDTNARPKLHVLKNGISYSPSTDRSNSSYVFDEPGLYKVWFSAATGEVEINEEYTYFLIINKNESRWAYEFSEYGNYYIKQIIKNQGTPNEQDLTRTLSNANMGNLIYKDTPVIENGIETTASLPYLKNLLLSISDEQTGNGVWTITVDTNNAFNQQFTFSLWINNSKPPIEVSVAENQATTDPIKVSFNTKNLLDSVGECILRINGMEDISFTYKNLEEGKVRETYTLTLADESQVYYIQILSQSGKLLYTYRAVKTAPLNTISIILIVVGVIVVVGLTIIFVLLRKKMKIR